MDSSAGDLLIRPMQLADIEQVHAIDVLSFSLPWSERSFRFELTENESAFAWVAEVGLPDGSRGVAGMIVIWRVVDEAHIGTIAVHPDFRGRGIGRRLLAASLLEMIEKGAFQALLEVRRSNLPAQALYRHFGFVVVGIRPRYYHDNNEDALLMTLKPLDAEALRRLMVAPN